jgi:hypothetical protein
VTPRWALVVFIIIVVMLAAVWRDQGSTGSDSGQQKLFPELQGHLGELGAIEVLSQPGKVTLLLEENRWVVAERHHYQADFAKINTLVEALVKAKLVERKTAKPANHRLLGLDDLATQASQASQARRVSGVSGEYEFSVLIGNQSDLRMGSFVRRESEDQVWLTDVVLNPTSEAPLWLDSIILNVAERDVLSAEFFSSQGESRLRAYKTEAAENWQLAGAYEGLPLKYSTIVNAIGRALINLRLVDVALHDPDRWKTSRSVKFQLKDEDTVTIRVVDVQGQYWLRVENTASLPDQAKWDYQIERTLYDEFVKTAVDYLQEQDEPGQQ